MNQIVIKNIKRIMKEKELTMYAMGKKEGLSRQAISNVLRYGNPTIFMLQKISVALDVNIKELFKEVE